jgi:hypothetical protein
MNEVCRLLRPSLELYAEERLASSRLLRRIQRHLAACAACRAYLEAYDALTRRILASAAPNTALEEPEWLAGASSEGPRGGTSAERLAQGRSGAIFKLVAALPPPHAPAPRRIGRPLLERFGWLAAGVLIALGIFFHAGRHKDGARPEPGAGRLAVGTSESSTLAARGAAGGLVPAVAGDELEPKAALESLRWILAQDLEELSGPGVREHPGTRETLLYGLQVPAVPVQGPVRGLQRRAGGMVVEALLGSPLPQRGGGRLILVPEARVAASRREAVDVGLRYLEIVPLQVAALPRGELERLEEAAGRSVRAYRLVPVPAAQQFGAAAHPPAPVSSRPRWAPWLELDAGSMPGWRLETMEGMRPQF